MSSYKPYPTYSELCADWTGKIPSDWSFLRIGSVFEERREKVSDKDFKPLSVTKNGILPQLENAAKTNDGDNRKGVKRGDFVINSRSDRKGSSGIADEDGSVSLINIVLQPKGVVPKFSEYLLKSYNFKEEFYRYGHGIVDDLWTTRFADMKGILIPLPPKPKQTAIAQFLDRKTAEIKAFIELKEKTISLLKERKTAIINQAVTKGLDPNVEMKDSGVEWLGEIPKHWEVRPVGSFFLERKENNKRMKEKLVLSLSHGTVKRRVMDNKGLLPESFSTYQITHPGDIVFRLTDLQNDKKSLRNGQTKETGIITSAYLCIYTNRSISAEYINYLFRIYDLKKVFYAFGGGIRQGAGYSEIRKLKVIVPPLAEQNFIVQKIEEKLNEIDQSIISSEKEITLIKEYLQSLISEVVTGKIDVRGEIHIDGELKTVM
jgi:type I restriction enzyme S subunit